MKRKIPLIYASAILLLACNSGQVEEQKQDAEQINEYEMITYKEVTLTSDLAHLSENDRAMIPHLIDAAKIMDDLFWMQSYGDKEQLLASIDNEEMKKYAAVNYGPWDRLNGDAPFIASYGEKPNGSTYYPTDMTVQEFEDFDSEDKSGLYTVVQRDQSGALITVSYHELYADQLTKASESLRKAAELSDDPSFKAYLLARADALTSDAFTTSDELWLDMETNPIDIIIGPIENYEDKLFGYKTAYESYVLVKDVEWSEKLKKYVSYLPELQKGLPVDAAYKSENPGTSSQLNAYDVIYYAGDCNSGSKTIAVNLPNDEELQQRKGTRRSQLKNAMKAKFDHILLPISDVLIAEDQRKHITFNAFFSNTMFHEVAHGLGIKNTIDGSGTVRKALKDQASALEEGKADILGLYMITSLYEQEVLTEGELEDYYVTFLASIFRSVRFGASSAHGKANMLRFNYFRDAGAFVRNEADGTYRMDMEKMKSATASLSALILKLQGDGNYEGVSNLMKEKGSIDDQLQADLDRLKDAQIPVDIVFNQGVEYLEL